MPMQPGSIVIVHLMNPTEKYWGVLDSIQVYGLTIRGVNVASFDDWIRSLAYDETPALGLATVFFPMTRVERMFLDEHLGEVDSMSELFEQRVGKTVETYLQEFGVDADTQSGEP